MSEISKEDLDDKQPEFNISMLGVYDVHFCQIPGGRCRECWMVERDEFFDWCKFYKRNIINIEHNPDCRVSSIIVKEQK